MSITVLQGTFDPLSTTKARDLRQAWVGAFSGVSGWTIEDHDYVNGTSERSVIVNKPTVSNIFEVTDLKGTTGEVEYLIVAGGGSGNGNAGGGGGAGGVLTGTTNLTATTYPIVVGNGGIGSVSASQDGENSTAFGLTAIGGGGGGRNNTSLRDGKPGGSGGGAHGWTSAASGGAGTAGQGNDGGDNTGSNGIGAGGGGAGAAGANAQAGGNGGDGIQSSITGKATYYAGGGGGSAFSGVNATTGGLGGGGNGGTRFNNGQNGAANTGGGGGGAWEGGSDIPGNGGSGIVIVRYKYSETIYNPDAPSGTTLMEATGGLVSYVYENGETYKVHTFVIDTTRFALMLYNSTDTNDLRMRIAFGKGYDATTHTLTDLAFFNSATFDNDVSTNDLSLSGKSFNPDSLSSPDQVHGVKGTRATSSMTDWTVHISNIYSTAIMTMKTGDSDLGKAIYFGEYESLIENPLLLPVANPYVCSIVSDSNYPSGVIESVGNANTTLRYSRFSARNIFIEQVGGPAKPGLADYYSSSPTESKVSPIWFAREDVTPINIDANLYGHMIGKYHHIVHARPDQAVWGETVEVNGKVYMLGGKKSTTDAWLDESWWVEIGDSES